jgi:hypothetical protein
MYQPELKEWNIRNLYRLKVATKKPMTKLINAILEAFFDQLEEFKEGGTERIIENGDAQIRIGSIQLSFLNKDTQTGGTENNSLEKPCTVKNKGITHRGQGRRE